MIIVIDEAQMQAAIARDTFACMGFGSLQETNIHFRCVTITWDAILFTVVNRG